MRVTIKDVARTAGVSVGTVSRAFNGYTDINEETKKKILETAAQLEYTPNAVARSLSSRVSKNMGIILTNFLQISEKDNGTLPLLQGIYQYTSKHGYDASIYMSDENSHTKISYEKFCTQHNISGAILSGITTKDPYFKELVTGGMPCVLIDVNLKGKGLGCVSMGNRKAAAEITQYLVDHGHREIMVIAGKKEAAVNSERVNSVISTLALNGIVLKESRIAHCGFSEEKAYKFTLEYLKEHGKKEVTAFLCLSDLMAFGCMKAMKECGYSVPDDFSITGFDNNPLTMYTSPQLTTIAQDLKEIGYQSAKLLNSLIKNPEQNLKAQVGFELCERESVKSI